MADRDIIQFHEGDKLTIEETNQNNLLLKEWALDNRASETYINTKMAELEASLNASISSINTQISGLNTTLNNKGYVKQSGQDLTSVGIGKTQMSTYLPQDGKKYLVWFNARLRQKSNNAQLTVASDIFTTARVVYKLDDDYDRQSQGVVFGVIPASSNGYITFGGTRPNYIALVGYCRL